MDERLEQLERRVLAIEQRNERVEKDKAWETSMTRILIVAVLTYFVAVLAFWMLGNQQFLLSALVPTAGFILSMQSVPVMKKFWMNRR